MYLFADILPLSALMISIKIVIDHYYRKLSREGSSQNIDYRANYTHKTDTNSWIYEDEDHSVTRSLINQKESIVGLTSSISKYETFIEHEEEPI